MATSDILRITLIATGDQAGTWGTTTNTNLGTILEDAIAGYAVVSVTAASQAFTIVDGAYDQARLAMIQLTTPTTANFAVYAPPVSKQYVFYNNSSYTATIYNSSVAGNTTAAGTGVTIPAGKIMTVWSNGTNFYVQNSHVIGTVVGISADIASNSFILKLKTATDFYSLQHLYIVQNVRFEEQTQLEGSIRQKINE